MFTIPAWLTNVLFFITIYLSGFQHVRLFRQNPIRTLQFWMIAFSLVMILVVVFYNRVNPWLSLAFFVVAAGSLVLMIRQQRYVPPRQQGR